MVIKSFILLIMLFITFNLFSALYSLLNQKDSTEKTAYYLTWRIGLSFGLFALLILGVFLGIVPINAHPSLVGA